MTDFAQLLLGSLPGIYRQKDENSELARFLQIMASPLTETEASIGQLYDDLFGASARGELLSLIGDLIGADVDPALPASLQRAALDDSLAFSRSKGLADPLERTVAAFTGWQTVAVDTSQVMARLPYLETLSPIVRRRVPAGVATGGTNRFTFDPTQRITALFDELRGRAIARAEIAPLAALLIGTDRGFSIRDTGVDLVGPRAASPRPVVAANLTSFDDPRALDNTPLVLAAQAIAVDPELGRLLFAAPVPAPGNLTVEFFQLVPASIPPETFDVRDPDRMPRLGRSDDPAPYSIDLRSPERPGDRIGRAHFDNHGLFLTVGRRMEVRRPNQLRVGPPGGFSFDDRPLAAGDTVGNVLQLQDGIDGSPLTVNELSGHEADFADASRGFTIRARGISLLDPSFGGRVVAARLGDLANPKNAAGAPLALQTKDIAVDPQLGRFVLSLAAFGITADDLRVSYLLANAPRTSGTAPQKVGPAASTTFAFASDGSVAVPCDALDGTAIAIKLRLGAVIADFHGKPRGYRVFAGATELTQTLTPVVGSLEVPTAPSAGQMLVDLDRGRFSVPSAALSGGALTVEYSAVDGAAVSRVFDSLAQRVPRLAPASIVPVTVDTRKPTVDFTNFELVAKATKL